MTISKGLICKIDAEQGEKGAKAGDKPDEVGEKAQEDASSPCDLVPDPQTQKPRSDIDQLQSAASGKCITISICYLEILHYIISFYNKLELNGSFVK